MGWWDATSIGSRPVNIYDYAAPQAVSTETPLLPLTELGTGFVDLRFILDNQSANKVLLVVEHGETNAKADVERTVIEVAAGKEGSVRFRDALELCWSMSAYADPDAGYPSSNVRWKVVGKPRR